jgi:hypothetical protein
MRSKTRKSLHKKRCFGSLEVILKKKDAHKNACLDCPDREPCRQALSKVLEKFKRLGLIERK